MLSSYQSETHLRAHYQHDLAEKPFQRVEIIGHTTVQWGEPRSTLMSVSLILLYVQLLRAVYASMLPTHVKTSVLYGVRLNDGLDH